MSLNDRLALNEVWHVVSLILWSINLIGCQSTLRTAKWNIFDLGTSDQHNTNSNLIDSWTYFHLIILFHPINTRSKYCGQRHPSTLITYLLHDDFRSLYLDPFGLVDMKTDFYHCMHLWRFVSFNIRLHYLVRCNSWDWCVTRNMTYIFVWQETATR